MYHVQLILTVNRKELVSKVTIIAKSIRTAYTGRPLTEVQSVLTTN